MKNILICILSVVTLYTCKSIDVHNEAVVRLHPVEDIHQDIDKLYKQLKRHHPRLYQYTPKQQLDFKFDSLKQSISSPMTSRQLHKQLAQVTKYIGQGHMSISPPYKTFTRKERKALNKMRFGINNIDTEYVNNKLIVRNARHKDTLLINAEILAVNGKNTKDLISEFKKGVASDGYNTTFHPRVVGYRFFSYYKQANGRFDSISLTLRNADSTFVKTYKRVPKQKNEKPKDSVAGDSLQKKPKKQKLTKAEKKAKKLKFKKRRDERRKKSYDYTLKEYRRELTFIGEDSAVGYLKIKGFTGGKYKAFHEDTFKTLDSLKTEVLIIDLRNNFGGSLNEINNLYSYLTDKNFTIINPSETNSRIPVLKATMSNTTSPFSKTIIGVLSPVILTHNLLKTKKRDGKLYYKFKAAKEHEPNPLNFKGKLYVLINGNSFSASSILSTQLQGTNRATFVGEETGGAYNGTVAGIYKLYELPNTKIKARIGLMHIDSKFKTTPDGYGIKPDVEISPTYNNRLNGIDPELEWVLSNIQKKK
ncbi:S41 family peptidase [uncultured Winogradskyella sp.]|uniref:S41 family peptidase n=1 Tax=uncultured Winogradskyella sp. TaxID=395353 RepID=UPI002607DDB5|nr:S41 family peptidase [uncultured Winogradskyella sp.]